MKALVYNGPKDVAVKDVPDAKIEKPTDALVEITSTNICGSDLHMYEGRTDVEKGSFDNRKNGWTKVVLKPSAERHDRRKTASA
jgi:glutathione-independent formaldehyde dehydrogenase